MIQLAMSARGFVPNRVAEAAAAAREAGIALLELPIAGSMGECAAQRTLDQLSGQQVDAAVCALGLGFPHASARELADVLDQSVVYAATVGARLVNLYCGALP